MPHKPLVSMQVQLNQLLIGLLLKIERPFLGLAIDHLVDATTAAMAAVTVVTFTQVMPVGDKNTSVRSIFNGKTAEPGIDTKE